MTETELRPCPFCGYEKAGIRYREARFIGQCYDGTKTIMFRVYGYCKRCNSRSKPITVIITNVHEKGWLKEFKDKFYPKAAEEWNRRDI